MDANRPGTGLTELAATLSGFAHASPELLSERTLLMRTDTKFLMSVRAVAEFLSRIHADYALLMSGDEALAPYRPLYFDTPGLRCFHDHRRGRRARHKVRIRHYPARSLSFMEIKSKRSERITSKHRLRKTFGEDHLGDAELAFIAERCGLPASELHPQVWTNFRRITLLGLRTNERVTIDVDLAIQTDEYAQELGGVAIVEIKQSPFCIRTPVMQASRVMGHRPASASKYCTALALTRAGLRVNSLLPTLRAVERLRRDYRDE